MAENLQNQGPVPFEQSDLTANVHPLNNEDDHEFSLSDLANEYLSDDSSSLSVNTILPSSLITKPDKSEETDYIRKYSIHISSPGTSHLTNILSPTASDPFTVKSLLESILCLNHLPSNDVANSVDNIWKETSSLFGQMLCTRTTITSPIATKQVSTCLFDRSLYERLTRLIAHLPKHCIQSNVQQPSTQHNLIQSISSHHNTRQRSSKSHQYIKQQQKQKSSTLSTSANKISHSSKQN